LTFELTPEERDIKQAARELDEKEEFDHRSWKKAAELGFIGVFIDEAQRGAGLGHFEQCLIIEEFARVDTGIAQCMVGLISVLS
jgi:alkylation response protein AidB-like acyl-CoA dehydrogenase